HGAALLREILAMVSLKTREQFAALNISIAGEPHHTDVEVVRRSGGGRLHVASSIKDQKLLGPIDLARVYYDCSREINAVIGSYHCGRGDGHIARCTITDKRACLTEGLASARINSSSSTRRSLSGLP